MLLSLILVCWAPLKEARKFWKQGATPESGLSSVSRPRPHTRVAKEVDADPWPSDWKHCQAFYIANKESSKVWPEILGDSGRRREAQYPPKTTILLLSQRPHILESRASATRAWLFSSSVLPQTRALLSRLLNSRRESSSFLKMSKLYIAWET
jgi:hypothetical protein